MRASSPGARSVSVRRRRFRAGGLLLEDVVQVDLAAAQLAGAGVLNRLAAPRWVFILGMACPVWSGGGPAGVRPPSRRSAGPAGPAGPPSAAGRRRSHVGVGLGARSAVPRWLIGAGGGARVGTASAASVTPGLAARRPGPGACAARAAAWAFRSGPSTMVMLRPSCRGKISTRPTCSTASTTSSRMRRPSSGWCISRPRNVIVTLTLWPSSQEPLDLAGLRVEVALRDLGPVLHLLDGDVAGLAPGLLGLLGRLVLVLAVIHDPADGRVRLSRHLDQVEVCRSGDGKGLGQGLDADLLTVRTDEPHLAGANAIVDPGLVVRRRSYRRSLLIDAQTPPYAWFLRSGQPGGRPPKTTNGRRGKPTSATGRARATDRTRTHRGGRVGAQTPGSTTCDRGDPASLKLSDVEYQRPRTCPQPCGTAWLRAVPANARSATVATA